MADSKIVVDRTKKWIREVVIGCNFCPFAAKEIRLNTIFYQVEYAATVISALEALLQQFKRLDNELSIETILLIFPENFLEFDNYLELVALSEQLLKQEKYEGIYQLASFHPEYCFANESVDDAANYTNRSIYPMIHILRESGIDKALLHYLNPEEIPNRNVQFAREKGTAYMKMLKDSCMKESG